MSVFYQNIYKKPDLDEQLQDDCIKNFLGDDICNSRLVQDSIIPENTRLEFEEPISIEELDKSASEPQCSWYGRY
jgi:hypothetical protein